jgi:hypothetical protein
MKTTFRPVRHGARGFALILTMVFLLVSLIVFGSIMYWVSGNAKLTLRNNQFNSSEYAAEAGVETILAQMDRDFLYGSLTNSYGTLLPNQTNWPVGYTYSDTNGSNSQISVWVGPQSTTTTNLNSQFSGLYGFAIPCTITATAKPASASGAGSNWVYNVPATISEQLQFASIPLFQFAIFYNLNLEIDPGQPMTITGPVFCNDSIWEGSSVCTFQSTVSAVGTNDTAAADPFANNYSGSGGPTFSMAGQPLSGANALTMPIAGATNSSPTNVEQIINLPPVAYTMNWANASSSSAYSTNGRIYLANAADLFITNTPSGIYSANPSGTNTFVYFQDSSRNPTLALVTPDYYLLKKPWNAGASGYVTNYVKTNLTATVDCVTNVQFAGYSFITNATFKDWRENDTVQAVQIDIGLFNIWLTNTVATNSGAACNSKCTYDWGRPIWSMYVYNAVPPTSTTLPAVRVADGASLCTAQWGGKKYGLTVATPMPMYVLGNYNVQDSSGNNIGANVTTHTYPAALMADSITVLSGIWNDATTTKLPTPADTTVNAAMFEGIVQSNPNISGNYSGGVENFLRLLENWGGTLTYNGSIVVMFPSQFATNSWQPTGNYYNAPTRHWAFDLNFAQQSGLPPLTPQTKAVIRGQWSAY